jgi:hypothetical protein
LAVTEALGKTAPVGSETTPVMSPAVVDWENAGRQANRRHTDNSMQNKALDVIILFLSIADFLFGAALGFPNRMSLLPNCWTFVDPRRISQQSVLPKLFFPRKLKRFAQDLCMRVANECGINLNE